MRLRIAIMAAAALIGAAAFSHAAEPAAPDKGRDGNTPEMVDSLTSQTAVWDTRMNSACQAVLKIAEGKQREQLRAAQRLWVQYRDANCLYYDLGEGSIARIDAAECLRHMTEIRARELEAQK